MEKKITVIKTELYIDEDTSRCKLLLTGDDGEYYTLMAVDHINGGVTALNIMQLDNDDLPTELKKISNGTDDTNKETASA